MKHFITFHKIRNNLNKDNKDKRLKYTKKYSTRQKNTVNSLKIRLTIIVLKYTFKVEYIVSVVVFFKKIDV